MGTIEWALVGVIALGLLAALLRSLMDVETPRLFSGLRRRPQAARFATPKRRLRNRIRAAGGAARRIPDGALEEIVAQKRAEAEQLAATGLSAYADVERTLARALDGEASVIARLMRGERAIRGADETLRILVRHGVTPGADRDTPSAPERAQGA